MRTFIIFLAVLTTLTFIGCGDNHKTAETDSNTATASIPAISPDSAAKPDEVVHHIPSYPPAGRFQRIFSDSNGLQLTAAEAIGIQPITSLHSAYNLRATIQKITTCDAYYVDSLSHSMPYLVPKAAQLLAEIGKAFSDTVVARGGKRYKIKVTSIMRTDNTVSQLRRRNGNASSASCHRYGSTFDISYAKFCCCDSSFIVSLADLKYILSEVLFKMREQGRCYVKYEVKQGCFHVTARP